MDESERNVAGFPEEAYGEEEARGEEVTEKISSGSDSESSVDSEPDLPWDLLPPPAPKPKEKPNRCRYLRAYKVPRVKPPLKGKGRKATTERFPLREILFVPFLRKNPFLSQIMRIDGIATIKEAAALLAWSTIETALLVLNYLEAKKDEMRALRLYTCRAVNEHFKSGKPKYKDRRDCECKKDQPMPLPYIPMENSMFYNYKFSNPVFVWPYEKDFNIFMGLKAIDDYITLRLNWMKHTNFGISYDHYEADDSSINHVYSIVGCNMRFGYPIGQATFNVVFIIISKYVGAEAGQRVSARFFIEGNPVEFIPMYNDQYFTDRILRHITNRKIRYFSKFHMTDSILHKEHSTDQQMLFKRKLIRNYKKALASNAAITQKETLNLTTYAALCGFCISYDGQCPVHKEKCHWDELFTPEAAAKASCTIVRELDKTMRCPTTEIFWPDIKKPIKTLFGREFLLW
uniref:Glutamate--tRNA ligase n=1 Tax=Lygus hesperus TaxID=30085 RepID=A0A0A9Z908_LYGHE